MSNRYLATIVLRDADGNLKCAEAEIDFCKSDGDYGNGYHMGIDSSLEAFGFQGYDIRYDKDFCEDKKIQYIVKFYEDRFNGMNGSSKLIGIHVDEEEPAK